MSTELFDALHMVHREGLRKGLEHQRPPHPLERYTFQINYNPNCPSPWEVVTGGFAPLINRNDQRCWHSYGKTQQQAMDAAHQRILDHDRALKHLRAESQYYGLVCA